MRLVITTGESIAVAGLATHVERVGSGRPVVVLHHSIGPLWGPFQDQLAERWDVIQPDLPGFGRSERPAAARSPHDLAVLCSRLLHQLDLDDVAVVGLGLGGWIAAELTAMNPGLVSALALVGSAGIRPRQGMIHDPIMSGWVDYVRLGFSEPAEFAAVFGTEPAQELIDGWDRSREMTARLTWKPWMWDGALPTLIRGLDQPGVVVWGSQDHIVPLDCGIQFAELLPNARLEVVEGVGHNVDLERPDQLASLVDGLLASVAPAGRH